MDRRSDDRLLYDMSDVCRLLSISRSHVYREMAGDRLPYVMIGRSRRVTREALLAYIERLRKESA